MKRLSYAVLSLSVLACSSPDSTRKTQPAGPSPTPVSSPRASTPPQETTATTAPELALEPTAPAAMKRRGADGTVSEAKARGLAAGPVASPVPTAPKGPLSLSAELSNTHLLMPGNGRITVEVQVEAADVEDADDRPRLPMNIALVIDRSGSMRGDKIAHTRSAAKHLVNTLGENDTLAIVSYADDVRVDVPATQVSAELKAQALKAIDAIRPSGATNLSGGLFRGQEEVERHVKTGQVNRVIVMSDGLANRGVTDQKSLSNQASKRTQRGISVTTMGVGVDYNEDLMTALASAAGGNYYFIEKSKAIAAVFDRELRRMFATVAQATQLELLVEDGVDLVQVHGYTFERKGDIVTIPLSETFAAQNRSVIVSLQAPVVRVGRVRLLDVSLKYQSSHDKVAHTEKTALGVMVTKDAGKVKQNVNVRVTERTVEVQTAAAVNQAAVLLQSGDVAGANELLDAAAEKAEAASSSLGGSKKLKSRAGSLRRLNAQFKDAEAKPAAAAPLIKRAKEDSYNLAR